MKKLIILAVMLVTFLTGCNYGMMDIHYEFDRAIIKLANDEVIEVKVKQWTDYYGEQIQITAEDGTIYLTSPFRCDLISDKENNNG